MKASELIWLLKEAKKKHGDLDVMHYETQDFTGQELYFDPCRVSRSDLFDGKPIFQIEYIGPNMYSEQIIQIVDEK